MKNWFNELNCGRRSLNDEIRQDPAKTVVVSENMEHVRELIMQDHHVTYRDIEASFGISITNIDSILQEHWP